MKKIVSKLFVALMLLFVLTANVKAEPNGSDDFSLNTAAYYTALSGSLLISDGVATTGSNWQKSRIKRNSPTESADHTVEADVHFDGSSRGGGLLLRVDENNNGYAVTFSGGRISLYKFNAGTSRHSDGSWVGNNRTKYTAGTYHIKASVEGNHFTIYVDDVLAIDTIDATYPTGEYIGMYFSKGSNSSVVSVDNLNWSTPASLVPVNGTCGSDNGQALSNTPTNLCGDGTASTVTEVSPGVGPWTWTCYGLYGGTSNSCAASYIASDCQESDWNYSDEDCQPENTFTRTWVLSNENCEGGVSHPNTEEIACVYDPGDVTAPVISEISAPLTPTTDLSPDYAFSSSKSGSINYGGSCASLSTNATVGNNIITFNTLSVGTYSNCTITVTDNEGNMSNVLTITSFTIVDVNVDNVSPIISEITPVSTPTTDTTPNYTFSTNEVGVIAYGGDCSSVIVNATIGNNVVTFDELAIGAHNNCTITVTDNSGNVSNVLSVTGFVVEETNSNPGNKILTAGETLALTSDITWDSLSSTATSDNWAVITGPYNIIVSGDTDISYISFQNTGTVEFQTGIQIKHSVFENQSNIVIGSWRTSLDSNWEVSNTDFRNVNGEIRINSAVGTPTGDSFFTNNTISTANGNITSIWLTNREGFDFTGTVFYNTQIGSSMHGTTAGGMLFKNMFIAAGSDLGQGHNIMVTNESKTAITMDGVYLYAPYENPHPFGSSNSGGSGTNVFKDSVFEVPYNYDGANIISTRSLPREITGNILIGSGTLANSVGTHSGGETTVRRNTIYKTHADTTEGGIWISENGDYTGTINLYSNIDSGSVVNNYAIRDQSLPAQIITNSDYNVFHNITTPYSQVTVTSGQSNDMTVDPQFTDATRNLATWDASEGSGTGTEVAAIEYLLNKNGYNEGTKIQSNTPSVNSVTDLLSWVRAGFVPQNSALNGAGFEGDDIGAMDIQ